MKTEMSRIRVVQFIGGLATEREVGGAEMFALRLARGLDKREFDVAVLGLWQYERESEREWIATLQSEDIEAGLLATPTGRLVSDTMAAFQSMWSAVTRLRPDIVNSHSEQTDAINMLISLLHPIHPYAVRMMQTEQQWQDRPWLGAILLNLVFPFTFGVEVATSEAVRQVLDNRFLARLWAKRSILCYNGLDEATLQKAASLAGHCPLPEGMPEQRPRVGIVGRLTRQKSHCDLLDAMKIVLASRPAKLVVVGAGPLEAALRDQADRLGIQDSVHWLGHRQDALEIMAHLDLVVSSSLWEGFPAVLLEAMAMGAPVVATDVSGSREMVKTGETGILVPPHDPERLAEAILMILDDSLKARTMAERGRQLARRFTIQDAAARYAQIYRQVKVPHKTAKESGD